MKFQSRIRFNSTPDMTTMIDCTFQLTFFFMLTLNFSTDIQSDLVRLPSSEIARPSEGAMETRVTVQALPSGLVLFGGDQMMASALRAPLRKEANVIRTVLGRDLDNATVVIRADRDVPVGKVQEVIKICRETGFMKFVLRAQPIRSKG